MSGGSQSGGIVYFLLCDGSHWQTMGVLSHASFNAGFGYGVLYASGGQWNTALGDGALAANTGGNGLVAIGQSAMAAVTGGSNSVAIGANAMSATTNAGVQDIVIGFDASRWLAGSYNTLIGAYAGDWFGAANHNTILGNNVGGTTLATGSYNILIGTDSSVDTRLSRTSNFLNIGNTIFATGIATGTVASPAGKVGIGTTAPAPRNSMWRARSS